LKSAFKKPLLVRIGWRLAFDQNNILNAIRDSDGSSISWLEDNHTEWIRVMWKLF